MKQTFTVGDMKNIKFDFQSRNVVVTGGAQGIGLQITRDFLEAGAQVAVWDYSSDALKATKEELARYNNLHVTQTDVSKMDSCVAAAAGLPFKPDILINNAGITRDKSFAKMTVDDFQAVIDTNLTGLFNVTKSLLEKFDASQPCKRIINISSVVALYGNFGQTNYVAAKAGVIGMTKTWARELGKKGFTVNAVAPGFIKTKMVAAMPAEILKNMAEKVPVTRLGETPDISSTCLFLASEEAGYINGAVISVDGGLVC